MPGIIALSLVNACYTNIAMTVSIQRDKGILKRIRGTPLPSVSYFSGRIIQAIVVALILVAIVFAFGYVFYSVDLPIDKLPAFLVTLIVGRAPCVPSVSLSPSSCPTRTPHRLWSMAPSCRCSSYRTSSSLRELPDWLKTFANFFPISHLATALHQAFNPLSGSGIAWKDLAVVAVWGFARRCLALRRFSWEPRK